MNALRIDHTAIAVRSLDEAIPRYAALYGVAPSERVVAPDGEVEVAFLSLGDSSLELIAPLNPHSGVQRFLDTRGEGLHHIALAVADIHAELGALEAEGVELINREPYAGVHGLVAFIHPRAAGGVLIELVEHDGPNGREG